MKTWQWIWLGVMAILSVGVIGFFLSNSFSTVGEGEGSSRKNSGEIEKKDLALFDVTIDDVFERVKESPKEVPNCSQLISVYRSSGRSEEWIKSEFGEFSKSFRKVSEELPGKEKNSVLWNDICLLSLFLSANFTDLFPNYGKGEKIELTDKQLRERLVEFVKSRSAGKLSDIDVLHFLVAKYLISDKETNLSGVATAKVAMALIGVEDCIKEGGYITSPANGRDICRDRAELGQWPVLSEYEAFWGGCEMKVERINGQVKNYEFCATLADGTLVRCTTAGCERN